MRKASGKPKKSIWEETVSRYGQYDTSQGYGNPNEWRAAFNERFTREEVAEILDSDDPYVLLGVSNKATEAEIKSAFRAKMKIHHPDMGGDTKTAQKIIAAYQFLTDK
jgi:DnaJ-class molecular chaperone